MRFEEMIRHTNQKLSPVVILSIGALVLLAGCGRAAPQSPNTKSTMVFGSPEWNKAAAEDIRVHIISVVQMPGKALSWEDNLDRISDEEREALAKAGGTGQMRVVLAQTRGSGSREVRIVIILSAPLKENARLPVPETGSYIYIQEGTTLKPLLTNSAPSVLTLEIYQEKTNTVFFMDYPRDRVRCGGGIFLWDEKGHFREIGMP